MLESAEKRKPKVIRHDNIFKVFQLMWPWCLIFTDRWTDRQTGDDLPQQYWALQNIAWYKLITFHCQSRVVSNWTNMSPFSITNKNICSLEKSCHHQWQCMRITDRQTAYGTMTTIADLAWLLESHNDSHYINYSGSLWNKTFMPQQ